VYVLKLYVVKLLMCGYYSKADGFFIIYILSVCKIMVCSIH